MANKGKQFQRDIFAAAAKEPEQRISVEEERECIRRWQQSKDNATFERLLEAHGKFCEMKARHYHRRYPGINYDDHLQQVYLGFITAVDKYDFGKDKRLLTYAEHWIRAIAGRYAILNAPILTRPALFFDENDKKILKVFKELEHVRNQGVELSEDELANFEQRMGVTVLEAMEIWNRYHAGARSLDRLLSNNEGEGETFGMRLSDKRSGAFVDETISFLDMERVLGVLSPRQRDVIMKRFLSGDDLTFGEIAEISGVSNSAIQQVEKFALKKLRKAMKAEAPEASRG